MVLPLVVVNNEKLVRVPKWLQRLPAGRYKLSQLAKHLKRSRQSVWRTLDNLQVPKVYINTPNPNNWLIPNSFAKESVYLWDVTKILGQEEDKINY